MTWKPFPITEGGCGVLMFSFQSVEQTLELLMISHATALMWRLCIVTRCKKKNVSLWPLDEAESKVTHYIITYGTAEAPLVTTVQNYPQNATVGGAYRGGRGQPRQPYNFLLHSMSDFKRWGWSYCWTDVAVMCSNDDIPTWYFPLVWFMCLMFS